MRGAGTDDLFINGGLIEDADRDGQGFRSLL